MNRPTRYVQTQTDHPYLRLPLKKCDTHHILKGDLILEMKISIYDFFVESPTEINSIPPWCFMNLQGSITMDPSGNL